MQTKPTCLAIILLVLSAFAWAEEEPLLGPYEAEVTVEDQGAEQRRLAIQNAFEKVLSKVAEKQGIVIPEAQLTATLERAERYVQQYRYTEHGLWVLFDRRAVDAVMEQQSGADYLGSKVLLLKVTGVYSLPDYAQVMHYLNSLKVLSDVQPRTVTPDTVLFELTSRSGRQRVVQTILQDGFLDRGDTGTSILSFHYTP